jgi:hypothetical protein
MFLFFTEKIFMNSIKSDTQSNSDISNSMGLSVFICYNRDIVVTVKVYVVKCPNGTENDIKF